MQDNNSVEIRFFSAAVGEEINKEAYEFESILIYIEGRLKIVYKDNNEHEKVIEKSMKYQNGLRKKVIWTA